MDGSSFMVSLVSLAIVSLAAVVGVGGAPAGTPFTTVGATAAVSGAASSSSAPPQATAATSARAAANANSNRTLVSLNIIASISHLFVGFPVAGENPRQPRFLPSPAVCVKSFVSAERGGGPVLRLHRPASASCPRGPHIDLSCGYTHCTKGDWERFPVHAGRADCLAVDARRRWAAIAGDPPPFSKPDAMAAAPAILDLAGLNPPGRRC